MTATGLPNAELLMRRGKRELCKTKNSHESLQSGSENKSEYLTC